MVIQAHKKFLIDRQIFHAGNDLDGTTTFAASFDVDTENSRMCQVILAG